MERKVFSPALLTLLEEARGYRGYRCDPSERLDRFFTAYRCFFADSTLRFAFWEVGPLTSSDFHIPFMEGWTVSPLPETDTSTAKALLLAEKAGA